MNSDKKQLGQYYTTNYEKILAGMYMPEDIISIVEPFAGNGDLIEYIKKELSKRNENVDSDHVSIECYDIDPVGDGIIQADTIMDPPSYWGNYIITNPPYIARNKSDDKTPFDTYGENDLYKCFIRTILNDEDALGGIIIIPVNFFLGNRKNDIKLRREFLERYQIVRINLFEERVFDDTSSTVCAVQFQARDSDDYVIPIYIYPDNKKIDITIGPGNEYIIADEIINMKLLSGYKIERWTTNTSGKFNITNIVVKCLDSSNPNINNLDTVIRMEYIDDEKERNKYKDETAKLSARSYAVIATKPELAIDVQKQIVDNFNDYMLETRKKYHSMFLSSYREFARKRISFNLVYKIIDKLLIDMKMNAKITTD